MAYRLIIAEKPSVARDIARVLGCRQKGEGFIAGEEYRVTWALGHLVSLMDPGEVDERYVKWRAADLPMLPETIPLKVLPKTKKQYTIVRRLMRDKECEALICATDAGREGELIFRYLYRMADCRKPFERLWISSMTDEAIREGFAALKPGAAYDNLYESARCRSEADWLVGMNASRAFTLRYDALLSVGRVQTPTLAILVRRHHEIAAFTARDFWTVTADFGGYTGLWLDEKTNEKRTYDEARAKAIAEKVKGREGVVESVKREPKQELPPLLYDLTSLQRDANRLLGFTAKKTLATAQALYEEHKLLTYPRTDSRHLPRDMAARTRQAMQSLPEAYQALAAPLLEKPLPMPARIFDDAKVTDHHAILPTGKPARLETLPPDARALYDLVAWRLLAAFYPAHRYEATRVLTRSEGEPFESTGRAVTQIGWKAIYQEMDARAKKPAEETATLPALQVGERYPVKSAKVKAGKTQPPAPHTDASLLAAMEHAGREVEDEALRVQMQKSGLGTPATRAAIIERLLTVGYAERKGRAINATEKGVRLIAVVPEDIASPETTGRWEKALHAIAEGSMAPDRFMAGIRRLAAALVEKAAAAPQSVTFEREPGKKTVRSASKKKTTTLGIPCPLCGQGQVAENSKSFYCTRFREGCGLNLWKDGLQRAGGPLLTAALVKRALQEGSVRGSTGVIRHEKGRIWFERGRASAD
jgi:DNA topoisomerase-3